MKTVFIRAIEAPVDGKAAAVIASVGGPSPARFELDVSMFDRVPRSPFAYWVGDGLRSVFTIHRSLAFDAKCGMGTLDDFRFLRLGWELSPEDRQHSWRPFAKGGAFNPYYSDVYLAVDWADDGAEVKSFVESRVGSASRKIQATSYYFRPGLTWSRRTQGGLSIRMMPSGCIFADKGPAAFVQADETSKLQTLAAIANSRPFATLVDMQMTFGSYEVGVIQRTPVPNLSQLDSAQVGALARKSWALRRRLDSRTESSHAFVLPALLQVEGDTLLGCAQSWGRFTSAVLTELDSLASAIDDHAFRLYGISEEDRQRIEQGFGAGGELVESSGDVDVDESEVEVAEVDAAPLVASLVSWSVGVAFGRFDVRLATGEREAPPEPEPFDPLPVCSPGMLTGDDGLPVAAPPSGYPLAFPADGILVDDPGHPRDVVRAVRSVFDAVFDDANARWHEAAEPLGVSDVRTWFGRDFFELHIKRYSRSRRKAPIYWQFGTASGSYSVWVYIHRATGDTLFRVLNDFVGPKLDHERAKLDGLLREAGSNPSTAQRRAIEQQGSFVGELQALRSEVARVAPLWKPDLDDGVILNFAPLWRLVPQSRGWQGDCKKAWDTLVAGDYDWAHIAMHLWPERVVPKCADDRSLAIAHGLEGVFWDEDESGAWRQRRVDDAAVQKLVDERTRATVKAALADLVSAASPAAGKGRKVKGRSASARGAAPKPRPAAARVASSDAVVDEVMLRAVRAAIAKVAEGASRADVLAATGLSEADWSKAIGALLGRGEVTRSGQKRGTRYHADAPGEDT